MNTIAPTKGEGEYGVKFNEPTTGEIVRALRCVAEETECKDCRYKYPVGNVILCDHEQMNGNAADRLESQEQKIAELTKEPDYGDLTEEKDCAISLLASLVRTHPQWKPTANVALGLIAKLFDSRNRFVTAVSELTLQVGELTVRAEQAERERDAAIKDTRCGGCTNCKYHHYLPTVQRHEKCRTCRDRSNYEWRGLPQDGEGT